MHHIRREKTRDFHVTSAGSGSGTASATASSAWVSSTAASSPLPPPVASRPDSSMLAGSGSLTSQPVPYSPMNNDNGVR